MPEPDGNTLPHEQPHFNLQGIEQRRPRADELLDIGLKGLNKTGVLPFAIESFCFTTANKNYEEAVESYRYGLYEAAMVMVRATIDAALCASKYMRVDTISNFDRDMGGSLSGHWIKIIYEKEVELRQLGITVKVIKQKRIGSWHDLREEAETLGIAPDEIDELNRIRDRYGNFSAHNAIIQMEENHKYALLSEEQRRLVKKPKWFITESQAYYILRRTGQFLAHIRGAYTLRTLNSLNWVLPLAHTWHLSEL
jgi:hypothetical protein